MAKKLHFRYGTMNCGKGTDLIQTAYNYEERGMNVAVMKPLIDTKGHDTVVSRIGVERKVDILVGPDDSIPRLLGGWVVNCVLVDEAQFLTPEQAEDLFWYVTEKDVPVIAYGLRTDFQGLGFPGSTRLLELAHDLKELKTICRCGEKAVLNGRKIDGQFVHEGSQVAIDDNARIDYEALCARDYRELVMRNPD